MSVQEESASRPSPTLTVEEWAADWKLGRSSAYEAVRRGDVPSIRIGRRILIPRAALDRFLLDAEPRRDADVALAAE